MLWLDEKFDSRGDDEALLATCNLSNLTRELSANRKFDLATFFYFGASPEGFEALEWSIVRKFTASRCLPPTFYDLLPRYLIVFVDVLGSRKGAYQIPPSWSCLERATLTTLTASGPTRDCSYNIAHIRENRYNAVVLISAVIPARNLTTIDTTETTASTRRENPFKNTKNISMLSVLYVTVSDAKLSDFWRQIARRMLYPALC